MHYLHRFRNLSQIRSIQYHHLSTIPIDMMTNTLSKATLQSYVTYLYHFIRNFLFFLTFFKDIILLKMNMGGLFGDYGASGDLGGGVGTTPAVTSHKSLFNCVWWKLSNVQTI
eukprot:278406_1